MAIIIRTLAERIFDVIRERIVSGELPVDEPVRQDALATELGVSKIPLREALARLEQDGLLFSHANRGWFVRPMSAQEAEEIYDLRLAIEPPAAARACRLATDEDREAVMEAFKALDRAASDNLNAVAKCNREFHTLLVRPCNMMLTRQLIERLEILAERYVLAHLEPAGREDRAHLEHKTLLDVWLARDEEKVRSVLTHHIGSTLNDLRSHFMMAEAAA
ncbi:MAG: GntR family transcriptional regulator [Sphingobium sp.]|nr:GntR family transcriptional regulator [Sphingobium sp.]